MISSTDFSFLIHINFFIAWFSLHLGNGTCSSYISLRLRGCACTAACPGDPAGMNASVRFSWKSRFVFSFISYIAQTVVDGTTVRTVAACSTQCQVRSLLVFFFLFLVYLYLQDVSLRNQTLFIVIGMTDYQQYPSFRSNYLTPFLNCGYADLLINRIRPPVCVTLLSGAMLLFVGLMMTGIFSFFLPFFDYLFSSASILGAYVIVTCLSAKRFNAVNMKADESLIGGKRWK